MNTIAATDAVAVEFDPGACCTDVEDATIAEALRILESRIRKTSVQMHSANWTKQYLRLHYQNREHEEFNVLFLDPQCRLVANEMLSRGTLCEASVYPREIAKMALKHNAANVILVHNHPCGDPTPSRADISMTRVMIQAMQLIGVSVLDHFVVGSTEVVSLAEHTGGLH